MTSDGDYGSDLTSLWSEDAARVEKWLSQMSWAQAEGGQLIFEDVEDVLAAIAVREASVRADAGEFYDGIDGLDGGVDDADDADGVGGQTTQDQQGIAKRQRRLNKAKRHKINKELGMGPNAHPNANPNKNKNRRQFFFGSQSGRMIE